MTNTLDSSLLYTRADGTQGFVHDTVSDFFVVSGIASALNVRVVSIEDAVSRCLTFSNDTTYNEPIINIQKWDPWLEQLDHMLNDVQKREFAFYLVNKFYDTCNLIYSKAKGSDLRRLLDFNTILELEPEDLSEKSGEFLTTIRDHSTDYHFFRDYFSTLASFTDRYLGANFLDDPELSAHLSRIVSFSYQSVFMHFWPPINKLEILEPKFAKAYLKKRILSDERINKEGTELMQLDDDEDQSDGSKMFYSSLWRKQSLEVWLSLIDDEPQEKAHYFDEGEVYIERKRQALIEKARAVGEYPVDMIVDEDELSGLYGRLFRQNDPGVHSKLQELGVSDRYLWENIRLPIAMCVVWQGGIFYSVQFDSEIEIPRGELL